MKSIGILIVFAKNSLCQCKFKYSILKAELPCLKKSSVVYKAKQNYMCV